MKDEVTFSMPAQQGRYFSFFILLLLLGCGGSEAPSEKPRPVRIGYPPLVANAPLYVAMESDLFGAEGLMVEAVKVPSSNDSIEALLRGDIDIAVAPPFNLIFAAELRAPGRLRVLTVNDETDTAFYFESLIVPTASPIKELADLRGKRVGCFPGSFAAGMLRAIMASIGIGGDAFTPAPMDVSLHIPSLEAGQIDALLAYEPTATIALRSGKFRLLEAAPFPRRIMDPFPNSAITMSREFARNRPEDAAKAERALLAAVDAITRNPESCEEAIAKWTSVDRSIIHGIPQQRFRRATPDLVEPLQEIAKLYCVWGVLDSPPDIYALIKP